jgi:hypothetical protein
LIDHGFRPPLRHPDPQCAKWDNGSREPVIECLVANIGASIFCGG